MLDFPVDARTAIRIACGLFFLPHTVAKLRHVERASTLFHAVGFRPARLFVIGTAIAELIAAACLISGQYVQIGAAIAAAVLVGAAYAIVRNHGFKWRWQHPGAEYMLFWALMCLFVAYFP